MAKKIELPKAYPVPDNWKWIELGKVVKMKTGYPFQSSKFSKVKDGYRPLIRIRDIIKGYTETYTDEECPEEYIVHNGDILIGMDGDFNIAKWNNGEALLNQRVCTIQSEKAILLNDFMFYFLPDTLKKINDATPSVTVKHLSTKTLEKTLIPVPPLAEQQRIVEQIESLFVKLDVVKEKIEDALERYEIRKASIMYAAFNGKLTKKWRKQNNIDDDSWSHVTLGEIAKFHQGVQVPVEEQYDEKTEARVRFIRIIDYTQGNEVPRYVSKDKVNECAYVYGDEIVVVRYGASAGFVGDGIEGVIANNMFTITVSDELKEYVKLYLRSPYMYKILNTSGGSSAMPALNFKVVSKIEISIPIKEERLQICKYLSSMLEEYEKTECIYKNILLKIELMKKSILAKTFRGKLGTNNPDEESAVELLKSILATE